MRARPPGDGRPLEVTEVRLEQLGQVVLLGDNVVLDGGRLGAEELLTA